MGKDKKGEAAEILRRARQAAATRERGTVPVDYNKLNQVVRRQRAALTRAVNSGDADRVVVACRDAVREWSQIGMAWPDDWSRWQNALNDALGWGRWVSLEDLGG